MNNLTLAFFRLLHGAKLHKGTNNKHMDNNENHFPAQTGQTYVTFAVDLQKLQLTRTLNVSRSAVFLIVFGNLFHK